MRKLLNNHGLKNSPIVANSLMNRERICYGGNSYKKELSFDILEFLKTRSQIQNQIAWLDICCGQGKALIEAAEILAEQNLNSDIKIIGVDLVGMFHNFSPELNFLQLIETSFEAFETQYDFDLITCVHGLHYIGDKLGFLQKAVSALKPNGVFLANLDLNNFKFADGKTANRTAPKELRKNGFEFDSEKHLLICRGKKKTEFNLEYLGADDAAGANYTGQAVVDSHYRKNIN